MAVVLWQQSSVIIEVDGFQVQYFCHPVISRKNSKKPIDIYMR